jgi:hypothetical protein
VQRKIDDQSTGPEDALGAPQDFSDLPEPLIFSDSSSED